MGERPTCYSCPFWAVFDTNAGPEDGGDCRRWPPVLKTPDYVAQERLDRGHVLEFVGIWPFVEGTEWCGEHPDYRGWIDEQRAAGRIRELRHEATLDDEAYVESHRARLARRGSGGGGPS